MFIDDEADLEANDAYVAEVWRWMEDRLPWLTDAEMELVCKAAAFPGVWAGYTALQAFVEEYKQSYTRVVNCKATVGGVTVPTQLDLKSGECMVRGASGLERIGMDGIAQFTCAEAPLALVSGILDGGVAKLIRSEDIHELVMALEKVSALPTVKDVKVRVQTAHRLERVTLYGGRPPHDARID